MENFQKAGIFSEILEVFQAFQKESKFLSCKILTFVTYMIYDISQLYFDNLSGVRLEPLLEYVNHSSESRRTLRSWLVMASLLTRAATVCSSTNPIQLLPMKTKIES